MHHLPSTTHHIEGFLSSLLVFVAGWSDTHEPRAEPTRKSTGERQSLQSCMVLAGSSRGRNTMQLAPRENPAREIHRGSCPTADISTDCKLWHNIAFYASLVLTGRHRPQPFAKRHRTKAITTSSRARTQTRAFSIARWIQRTSDACVDVLISEHPRPSPTCSDCDAH